MTTTITDTEQARRLEKARVAIVLDDPFFGSILMQLPMFESFAVPTFSVDGTRILYNPKFAASLTDGELKGVIVHELEHVVLLHPWRRGHRDLKRFNIAADYAINNYLQDYLNGQTTKSFKLPDNALIDPQYKDLSAEEIYARLPQPPPQPEQPSDNGDEEKPDEPQDGQGDGQDEGDEGDGQEGDGPGKPSSDGEFTDAPGDEAEQQESEDNMKVAIAQAVQAAQSQGNCPASLKRLVDKLLNPEQPWQEKLRDWMTQRANSDYNWSRPNRRYLNSGFVLPSLYDQNAMGTLFVAVDSSGSIGQAQVDRFVSELTGIMRDCQPERTIIIVCDAMVQTVDEFQRGEEPEVKLAGGGGTDFRPVFSHVAQSGEEPAGLIYMTDLYGSFPDVAPEYPVLWCVMGNDNGKGPWGETIHLPASVQ